MSNRIAKGCLLTAWLALFSGSAGQSAALLDAEEPPPPGILQEIVLPPLGLASEKASEPSLDLKGTGGKKYARPEEPDSPYCKAIQAARVLLWAFSTETTPKHLVKDVARTRKEMKLTPKSLETRFAIPTNPRAETQLKMRVLAVNQSIARVVARMEDGLEALKSVEEVQEKRPVRWQANLALERASLLLRIAHLEEHSLALGSLRKEFPPHGKNDRAWQLKASDKLIDFTAKKRVKEAHQMLKQLRKDYPGTVWDQQAEHVGRTMLGVEWAAVK
jgi:hypothetical protein